MEQAINLLVHLFTIAVLFFAFRKISWWYCGIDHLLKAHKKQELLMELILIQQVGKLPLVKVKEIKTGVTKEISIDGWIDLQLQYPNKFERVY